MAAGAITAKEKLSAALATFCSAMDTLVDGAVVESSAQVKEAYRELLKALAEMRSSVAGPDYLVGRTATVVDSVISGRNDFARRFESLAISKAHRSACGAVDGRSVVVSYEIHY